MRSRGQSHRKLVLQRLEFEDREFRRIADPAPRHAPAAARGDVSEPGQGVFVGVLGVDGFAGAEFKAFQ